MDNLFIHTSKKCGGSVYLDIASSINTICSFSVSKEGLRVNRLTLKVKRKTTQPVFYCVHCNESEISLENIEAGCIYCGNLFSIVNEKEEINYYPTTGGLFCNKCAEKRLDSKDKKSKMSIKSLMSKVLVTDDGSKKPSSPQFEVANARIRNRR